MTNVNHRTYRQLTSVTLLFAVIVTVFFFTGCGGSESSGDSNQELEAPIDAGSEIEGLLQGQKYTRDKFASLIEADGVHESYKKDAFYNEGAPLWKTDATNMDEDLYAAMESETEVVFVGTWGAGEAGGSFYPNGHSGILWQFMFYNPNCADVGGPSKIPHFVEVDISNPHISGFKQSDDWYKRYFALKLDGKQVILTGKIKSVIASGGESACKNGWLRVHLDGEGAKIFDVQSKQRVF